jgi:hypothetical protein
VAGLAIANELWRYLLVHLPLVHLPLLASLFPAGFWAWGFPLAGASTGLALTLGLCAGARRGYFFILAFAWLVADLFVNGWAGNTPSIALSLVSVPFLLLGILIGLLLKRPVPKEKPAEAAPVASKQWFGSHLASKAPPVLSVEAVLSQDAPDLDEAEEAVLHAPRDTSARQWLDWGNRFARKHLHRISVDCLEKALAGDLPERLRAAALLLVGAERKGFAIDSARGTEQLQELLSLKSPELASYTRKAAKMLAEQT